MLVRDAGDAEGEVEHPGGGPAEAAVASHGPDPPKVDEETQEEAAQELVHEGGQALLHHVARVLALLQVARVLDAQAHAATGTAQSDAGGPLTSTFPQKIQPPGKRIGHCHTTPYERSIQQEPTRWECTGLRRGRSRSE